MAPAARLVQLIAQTVIRLLPLLWRLIRSAFMLCVVAVVGLWFGVPEAVSRIVNEWLREMVIAGFPPSHTSTLGRVSTVFAYGMVVVGWILFVLLTDLTIRLLL